jgi:acyl carrier protein phosphodiesterase
MNFLAHLYLADDTPYSILGNMLGDFAESDFRERYNEEICRGIILHRKVDIFTDSHEIFLRSKRRVSDEYRLLKGIMIDIFYDHFLAKNWDFYSHTPLEDYSNYVYEIFATHQSLVPLRLQQMLPVMISGNWLLSYREIKEITWVLKGMSGRLSKKNKLAQGIEELQKNYDELENDFRKFFPRLVDYADDLKKNGQLDI